MSNDIDYTRPVERMPAVVEALGRMVHMYPIAWNVTGDKCVIVFVTGHKMVFGQDAMLRAISDNAGAAQEPPENTPIIHNKPLFPEFGDTQRQTEILNAVPKKARRDTAHIEAKAGRKNKHTA